MLDELLKDIYNLKDYKDTLKDLIDYHILEIHKCESDLGNTYYYITSKSGELKYWLSHHVGVYLMENTGVNK